MTDETAAIPQDRLTAYAHAAATMGDLQGLMASIHMICTDKAILKQEGRTNAIKGADRLLAGVVRRLCATAAWSEESAKMKVSLLDATKQLYGSGLEGRLMSAMINEAIIIETEAWLASPISH